MARNIFRDYFRSGVNTNVSKNLMDKVDRAFRSAGVNLGNRIISGFRTPATNKRGAKKSQHLQGNAVDIDVRDLSLSQRKELIEALSAAGVGGIGVYANTIHADIGPKRSWGPSFSIRSLPDWAGGVIGKHLKGEYTPLTTAAVPGVPGARPDATAQVDTFSEIRPTPQPRPPVGTLLPEDFNIPFMSGEPGMLAATAREGLQNYFAQNPEEAARLDEDVKLALGFAPALLSGVSVAPTATTFEPAPPDFDLLAGAPYRTETQPAAQPAPTFALELSAPVNIDSIPQIVGPGSNLEPNIDPYGPGGADSGFAFDRESIQAPPGTQLGIGPMSLGDADRMATALSMNAPRVSEPVSGNIGGDFNAFANAAINAAPSRPSGLGALPGQSAMPIGDIPRLSMPEAPMGLGVMPGQSALPMNDIPQFSAPEFSKGTGSYADVLGGGPIDTMGELDYSGTVAPSLNVDRAPQTQGGTYSPDVFASAPKTGVDSSVLGPVNALGGPFASVPPAGLPAAPESLSVQTQIDDFSSFPGAPFAGPTPPTIDMAPLLDVQAPPVTPAPVQQNPLAGLGALVEEAKRKAPELLQRAKTGIAGAANDAIMAIATDPDQFASNAVQNALRRGASPGRAAQEGIAARRTAQPRLYGGPQSGTSQAVQSWNEYQALKESGYGGDSRYN